MSHILVAIIAVLVGYHFGWGFAHYTVAKECERLEGFFVGKATYKCVKKEQSND